MDVEDDGRLKVFLSHSNKPKDYDLANQIISDLEKREIKIIGQWNMDKGSFVMQAITKLIENVDKTLIVLSENSLDSPWCSFELLVSLEKSQRTNQLGVVLLLIDLEEEQLPHITVLQEAPKIHYSEGGEWITPTVEALRDNRTVGDVMPAGNLAHGLVWSHFTGLLQYVLPELERKIKSSKWYKEQTLSVQSKVSFKLYELLPSSCTPQFKIQDPNIHFVEKIEFEYLRAGNYRKACLQLYKVKDSKTSEEYYCVFEYPAVQITIKKMEEDILASFSVDDKRLQLGRFFYTLTSIVNHFENCLDTTKVLPFNDEQQSVSEVLIDALKEEFSPLNYAPDQTVSRPPRVEKLESTEVEYPYEVYVAYTEDDKEKGQEIVQYLKSKNVNRILEDSYFLPGLTWSEKMVEASLKCRWFILLMTENTEKDQSLTFHAMSALGDSLYKKKVKVIPVVSRNRDLYIPELLRWITYIPYDGENKKHLESLFLTVTGRDIPMETQLLLPAGDVAYGLAWNFVTNYLLKVFPAAVEKIMEAFKNKGLTKVKCPRKLFFIIPRSCSTGKYLKDMKDMRENTGKIQPFSVTGEVFPFGNRPYTNTVYKVDASDNIGLYFAGQYAAPVTCLEEMEKLKIGGVNEVAKASEAKRFYELVSSILQKIDKEKAECCEIIYFDDEHESLSDIMVEKIRLTEPEDC